jgi:putative FmdB family regulatory protein
MPVYEFYCADCHIIFNFFSRRVNTERHPDCPKCGRRHLERQVSLFAYSQGRTEEQDQGMTDLDEAQMERAMAALAGEMDGVDENDPRQMARLMRRLSEATGMHLGEGLEEAMRRLDAGEDMEKIEEEMGDLFETENPFARKNLTGIRRKYAPPAHDDHLYPM